MDIQYIYNTLGLHIAGQAILIPIVLRKIQDHFNGDDEIA